MWMTLEDVMLRWNKPVKRRRSMVWFVRDLSSPTKDWTWVPAVETNSLSHWSSREILDSSYKRSLCVCVCVCTCSVSRVCLFVTPWTVAHQAPLSWNFPGKNAGVGCHFPLQAIFPTKGSNSGLLHLLHWQVDSLLLLRVGSPWGS